MVRAGAIARDAALAGLFLGLAGMLGACDLILKIGHEDRFIDPHVSCGSGTCVCTGGFDSCDGDDDNGCESELAIDPMNCGACGSVCANGACLDGTCACQEGFVDCDGSPSTGCEAELQVDPQNCGACGVRCAGGECQSGHCQPFTLTGLTEPRSLALFEDYLYVAQCSDPAVAKVWSKSAGSTVQPAAAFTGCASLVAAGDKALYFAAPKQVLSVPIDAFADLTPKDLAPGVDLFASGFFGVSALHVYFWNDDTAQMTQAMVRIPIDGGPVEPVADAVVTALAVGADVAYFSDQNGLHAWKTSDAAPTLISQTISAHAMTLVNGTLIFADAQGLWSLAPPSMAPAKIVPAALVRGLAADETHVYWAEGGAGTLRRVGRDGASETVLASGEAFGERVPFALDDEAVYWIAGSSVRKVAK